MTDKTILHKPLHVPWFHHIQSYARLIQAPSLVPSTLLAPIASSAVNLSLVAAYEFALDAALATVCEMLYRHAKCAHGKKTVYAHGCVDVLAALGVVQSPLPHTNRWMDARTAQAIDRSHRSLAKRYLSQATSHLSSIGDMIASHLTKPEQIETILAEASSDLALVSSHVRCFDPGMLVEPEIAPLNLVRTILCVSVQPDLFLSTEVQATLSSVLELLSLDLLTRAVASATSPFHLDSLFAAAQSADAFGILRPDSPLRPSVFLQPHFLVDATSHLASVLAKQSLRTRYSLNFAPYMDSSFFKWRSQMHEAIAPLRHAHETVPTVSQVRAAQARLAPGMKDDDDLVRIALDDLRLVFDNPSIQALYDQHVRKSGRYVNG
jgi:hypothetical protein